MAHLQFLFKIGIFCLVASCGFSEMISPSPKDVKIGGFLGLRLDACLLNNVKTTDAMALTDVFKSKSETTTWQGEFWGKWMHSAVPLWIYSGDAELKAKIDASVKNIMSTQRADGYIGNYTDEAQTSGPWDIWGRKYSMLGLLHYYDATGDQSSLKAACRVADHLMAQVGPGKKDIYKIGAYHGMASCSVLEPIMWLYKRTKERKYFEFAKYIVSQMEDPADSARLITKAMAGVDVADRFPHPKQWWSWENGQKAYEMMSCYQGLLEFYWATGEKKYLDAVVATADNIIATEINVAGSGAAFECWYHGKRYQTSPAFHMMETCVTTTWLRLCESLLRETGNPKYADQLEKTLYNAYLAALSPDASTFSKYCPLEGKRGRGENQCRMKTNCCIANGPRGFVALMHSIAMADEVGIKVNLYVPSTITIPCKGQRIKLEQKTEYPKYGKVAITVFSEKAESFALQLRIPAWSKKNQITINGTPWTGKIAAGSYVVLNRTWKAGDQIELTLEMKPRQEFRQSHFALLYGPLTLARDARFNDGNIHDVYGLYNPIQPVKFQLDPKTYPGRWICFTAKLPIGMNLETPEGCKPHLIHFCDFASAGNTWKDDSSYRVWQRVPLNVTHATYRSYNQE